jgi:hypothetical protein
VDGKVGVSGIPAPAKSGTVGGFGGAGILEYFLKSGTLAAFFILVNAAFFIPFSFDCAAAIPPDASDVNADALAAIAESLAAKLATATDGFLTLLASNPPGAPLPVVRLIFVGSGPFTFGVFGSLGAFIEGVDGTDGIDIGYPNDAPS